MPQKNTETTTKTTKNPIFSERLSIIMKNLGLDASLGIHNERQDEKGHIFYIVQPDTVRNWLLGRSCPNAKNYDDLRQVLSRILDDNQPTITIETIAKSMKDIMPNDNRLIDDLTGKSAKEVVLSYLALAYSTKGTVVCEEKCTFEDD